MARAWPVMRTSRDVCSLRSSAMIHRRIYGGILHLFSLYVTVCNYDLLLVLKRLKSDNVVTAARLALLVTFAVSYYISLMWPNVVGLLLVASARTLLYFIRKCLSLVERCLALRIFGEVGNALYVFP